AIVNYLNGLWSKAVDIVNQHHGIVNKFLGDGFMAVFGAPLVMGNHCQNAINAARELVADIKRATDTGEIPPTRIGIGLHSGEALVGNIGSAERREYTVIGDVVNVAFRIEQLNKEVKSSLRFRIGAGSRRQSGWHRIFGFSSDTWPRRAGPDLQVGLIQKKLIAERRPCFG